MCRDCWDIPIPLPENLTPEQQEAFQAWALGYLTSPMRLWLANFDKTDNGDGTVTFKIYKEENDVNIAAPSGKPVYLITTGYWDHDNGYYQEEEWPIGIRLDKDQAIREVRQQILKNCSYAHFTEVDLTCSQLRSQAKLKNALLPGENVWWVSKDGLLYVRPGTTVEIMEFDALKPLDSIL